MVKAYGVYGDVYGFHDEIDYDSERAFFQKVDRILSGKSVSVKEGDGRGVAYQSGNNIFINFAHIFGNKNDYDDSFIVCKGLNYHEIAHYFFTDYTGKLIDTFTLKNRIDNSKFRELLNILEDSRVELLMICLYPKAKLYFESAIYRYKISEFLLLYGRRFFVNKDLVTRAESTFVQEQPSADIDILKKLIDKYILGKEREKRLKIVHEIFDILYNSHKTNKQLGRVAPSPVPNNTSNTTSLTGSHNKLHKNKVDDIVDDLKEIVKKSKLPTEKKHSETIENEIKERVEKLVKKIKEDVAVDLGSIRASKFGFGTNDKIASLDDKALDVVDQLKNMVKVLKTDLKPHYKRKQKSGKLDMRAAINSENTASLKIFRKWKPSKIDSVNIAIGVLVDCSGSMGRYIKDSVKASMILNKVFEEEKCGKIGINFFEETTSVVKDFNSSRINCDYRSGGGTSILSSLCYMQGRLKKLSRTSKALGLIIISDGEVSDLYSANNVLDKINKGIETLWINVHRFNVHCNDLHVKHKETIDGDIEKLPKCFGSFFRMLEVKAKRRIKYV